MKTNERLYGKDVTVPPINEDDANTRIELLNNRLEGLLSVHFMQQDSNLIREVTEAMSFWRKLKEGDDI
jgi:hypothetical protein